MTSISVKLILSAVSLAFVLAATAPAAAKARKHKKVARVQTTSHVQGKYWGSNLFPAGPVYNGPDYLGDDPDPNIRFQLLRDLGAHYGGNE